VVTKPQKTREKPRLCRQKEAEWRPAWAMLPDLDTLERLSRPGGGQRQRELFPQQRDETREGRIARLLDLPGVVTADRLATPEKQHSRQHGSNKPAKLRGKVSGNT
jgi:hypothetical protein